MPLRIPHDYLTSFVLHFAARQHAVKTSRSVAENCRVVDGAQCCAGFLYLGDISDARKAAWCRTIEVADALLRSYGEQPQRCPGARVRAMRRKIHVRRLYKDTTAAEDLRGRPSSSLDSDHPKVDIGTPGSRLSPIVDSDSRRVW
jgi:hypothetical protein